MNSSKETTMANPILFCNIAWMKSYCGLRGDTPRGGGAYVEKYGTGSEIHNFNPVTGKMLGFVMVKGSINVERLGAPPGSDCVKNITVIWVSPSPVGVVIVGWYKNATVYKDFRHDPRHNREYNVVADPGSCRLLPVDERTFPIPRRGPGAMGQSNVWYADNQKRSFLDLVQRYIKSGGKLPISKRRRSARGGFPRRPDPLERLRVERKAVQSAVRHFEKLGYRVESVEKDNMGWDIEAYLDQRVALRIEVKGMSGQSILTELTPNEYRNSIRYRDTYRLCIVVSVLDRPRLTVFSYSPEARRWEDDHSNRLAMQRLVGARVTLE
jgi:hypothetical protein